MLRAAMGELAAIIILIAVIGVVILRLPKLDLGHTDAFRRRRLLNWLPLGLTYAFLYMGRYNIKVSQHIFEEMPNPAGDPMMGNADFATIFFVGTAVYGVAFLLNGPLTDRFGGKAAILVGAGGTIVANASMGLCTYSLVEHGPFHQAIAEHFVALFSVLYAINMYFQSFGAVAIVKVNAPWFHVKERGVFGAIFGILISLGIYFAYDWGYFIIDTLPLEQVFFIPAMILVAFGIAVFVWVRNSPAEAGHEDFDTADASSGDNGPRLGTVAVFKRMLSSPVILTIAGVEFCSGFLRQAIMQWFPTYAKHTNDVLGLKSSFVYEHWGLLLCCAGIMGGTVAGIISDRMFQSRRGPVAGLLYMVMVAGAIVLSFTMQMPIVGLLIIVMSMAVIGVHGMLSGTASMDFGGKRNVGVAVGIIDGFVYAGTAFMAFVYGKLLPEESLDAAGHLTGASTDPDNWIAWPVAMVPMAIIGTLLALRLWNARPQPKSGGQPTAGSGAGAKGGAAAMAVAKTR